MDQNQPNNNNGNNNNTDDPTQSDQQVKVIMVTIRSVMERGDLCRIQLRNDSTVRELRIACSFRIGPKAEAQSLLFDGKELKDDDKMLADYGLKSDCVVQLAPKMASGTLNKNPQADVILIIPDFIPQNVTSMQDLRETIRSMHTSLPSKLPAQSQPPPTDRKAHMWTPEKQMEHEVTRNRMKELIQRRKRMRQQQSAPKSTGSTPIVSSDVHSFTADEHSKGSHSPTSGTGHGNDNGSICGSVGRSPLGSEPGTPPEIRLLRQHTSSTAAPNASSTTTNVEPTKEPPVTAKELKMYFNPPETTRQADMLRRDLYTPPTNREGLKKIKEHFIELQKSTCGVCKRKLPLIQQSLKCRCKRVFCPKHRNAEQHKCSVDYKLAGRKKLEKEVPKIETGGAHKAKF